MGLAATGTRAARLETVLRAQLAPAEVTVADRSAEHAGHGGARAGGETHYDVLVVSARFDGLSRIARSRLVHEALRDEFAGGLHALSLTLRTPD